jgi:hypothetical protein
VQLDLQSGLLAVDWPELGLLELGLLELGLLELGWRLEQELMLQSCN